MLELDSEKKWFFLVRICPGLALNWYQRLKLNEIEQTMEELSNQILFIAVVAVPNLLHRFLMSRSKSQLSENEVQQAMYEVFIEISRSGMLIVDPQQQLMDGFQKRCRCQSLRTLVSAWNQCQRYENLLTTRKLI